MLCYIHRKRTENNYGTQAIQCQLMSSGWCFFFHSFRRWKSGESQLKLKQPHVNVWLLTVLQKSVRMHVCGHIKTTLPAGSDSFNSSFETRLAVSMCAINCVLFCFWEIYSFDMVSWAPVGRREKNTQQLFGRKNSNGTQTFVIIFSYIFRLFLFLFDEKKRRTNLP